MNNSAMSAPEAIKWHAEKIIELQAQLLPRVPDVPLENETAIQPAHTEIMFDCLGWHEVHDKGLLMEFFTIPGVLPADPDDTAWCAIFQWTALQKAEIDVPYTQNARALYNSLLAIGRELEAGEAFIKGDILGWGSHIASFAGYSSEQDAKATNHEEWVNIEDPNGETAMVIGGNQSNMINISPKHWYDRYSEFLGAIRLA